MCTKWKRFTIGANMLAFLALFLFGCGGGGGTTETPDFKTIGGSVADSTTGLVLPNAKVTAYAIDAAGNVATTSLSIPAGVLSNGQGNYVLSIPASYSGALMVQATPSGTVAKPVTTKQVSSLPASAQVLRTVLSVATQQQAVMLSLATEMMVQYIEKNKGGSAFTPENIKTAFLVMEPLFGTNFNQVPPPAIGSAPTPAQQSLLVITQALNSALTSTPGLTIADLVTVNDTSKLLGLGQGTIATTLTKALETATTNMINAGLVSGTFAPDPATIAAITTPVTEPASAVLSDGTAPSAPSNVAAVKIDSTTAELSWSAATDNVAVTGYYVYRNDIFIKNGPSLSFTDKGLTPATKYLYEVKARDAAGNVSVGSTINVTTSPILTCSISGTVANTVDGTALSGVLVTITGAGSGIAVSDSSGRYTLTGAKAGSYTITPSLAGYAFTPTNRTITVKSSDVTDSNFTAVRTGTVTGNGIYPNGVIIGGVTYPTGIIIGGVTYPTATIIGGVTYPTGTVIGGVTYPNGVVIGGVTYPPGTVVGGVAFPLGVATAGVIYPTGTVISSVTYPNSVVIGGVTYPAGTVVSGVTFPPGVATAGVVYPTGTVIGNVTYPNGTVVGGTITPTGSVIGSFNYPSGTVIGGVTYPGGMVVGGVIYPSGIVTGSLTYPNQTIKVLETTYKVILSGLVTDSAGVGLGGMNVKITDNGTGTDTNITTGFAGTYSFIGVQNGNYTITIPSSLIVGTTTYTFTIQSRNVSVSNVDVNIPLVAFSAD